MNAYIRQIEYHLPALEVTNADIARSFPEWSVEKIAAKTGIHSRHVAAPGELSSDLAEAAARKLFASGTCSPGDFDFLLLCTQSPDYFLPTTACILQQRLGLPETTGALDFNLGCSGYIYGLGLAKGLIETGQAKNVLLITAETYSKFMKADDKTVRTIFGDAAAATWVSASTDEETLIGPFAYGTDGHGAGNLIVRKGGLRTGASADEGWLFMNGPEIFNFTLRAVPECVARLLSAANGTAEAVDHFVMHQANQFMLEHLRQKLGIPTEKFPVCMSHCGNTVSSTIPIALRELVGAGKLKPGQRLALVGFGVGYSWGGVMIRWMAPASKT